MVCQNFNTTLLFAFFASLSLIGDASFASGEWNPEAAFGFAFNLEKTEDFYRAITEYHRVIFHWPDHPLAIESRYRIGSCYLKGHDHDRAVSEFSELLADTVDVKSQNRIRYALARALYYSDKWLPADLQLQVLESRLIPEMQPPVSYSRLWCRLKPGSINDARQYWDHVVETTGSDAFPDMRAIQISLMEMSFQPRKRPALAGVLSSLIPGAGQVYAGRWRDGLVSFVVNAVFIGAMAAAIERGHEESAVVMGFFELGFYTANVYNAVNNAHKTNRMKHQERLRQFERRFGPPFCDQDISVHP